MTIGKVQARGGKLPTADQLEQLVKHRPNPIPNHGPNPSPNPSPNPNLNNHNPNPDPNGSPDHNPHPIPSPNPDQVKEHPAPPAQGEVAVDQRTIEQLSIALAHVSDRAAKVQAELEQEEQKRAQWRLENARRRHNYVPFIIQYLKTLADRGELTRRAEAAPTPTLTLALPLPYPYPYPYPTPTLPLPYPYPEQVRGGRSQEAQAPRVMARHLLPRLIPTPPDDPA